MSHGGYGQDMESPYSGYSSQDGDQMGSAALPAIQSHNLGMSAAPVPDISTVPLKKTCEGTPTTGFFRRLLGGHEN